MTRLNLWRHITSALFLTTVAGTLAGIWFTSWQWLATSAVSGILTIFSFAVVAVLVQERKR